MKNTLLAALTAVLIAGFGTAALAAASGCSQNTMNTEGMMKGHEFSTTPMSGTEIPCADQGALQPMTGQQNALGTTTPNSPSDQFSWDIDKPATLAPQADGDDMTKNYDLDDGE